MNDIALWFKYIVIASFLLLGLHTVKSQEETHNQVQDLWQKARVQRKSKNFDQALKTMDEAIILQNNTPETLPYNLGFSHLLKGRIYLLTNVCALGEPDLKKAIDIFAKLDSADALFRATVRMAELYKTLADYETSIFYYEEALAISQKYWGEINSKAGVTYGNIGFNYYYLEDYETTKIYMEKYRIMLEKALPSDNLSLAKCYNNYGSISWRINQFEKAQEYYLKCLTIYQKKLQPDDSRFLELFNNLGGIYINQQDTVQALKYYQQAMDTEALIKGEEIDTLTNVKGGFDIALQYYQRTLERRKRTFGTQHPSTLGCYLYIGETLFAQGLNQKALESYQLMINGLLPEFDNDSIESNPNNFTSAEEEPLLLSALTQKAEIFYSQYQSEGDSNRLKLAFSTYISATKLIDQIREGYKTEASYIFWTKNLRPTYDRAIEIGFELYDKTGDNFFQNIAFSLAEKSRSFNLLLGIRGQKAIKFSGISETLLEKESSLRDQLNTFHQAILSERKKGRKANREKVELFGDKKLKLERAYSRLIKQIENDYPSYFDLKYNSASVSPNEVQQFLEKQEVGVFIEYVWSGEQLYAFLITSSQKHFISLGNSSKLELQINQLRKSIGDWKYITEQPAAAYQDYTQTSINLYRFLLEPIEKYLALDSTYSRLIISPDGILGYLPFELLLTDSLSNPKRDYTSLPYLLKKYAISYANSATLLTQFSEKTKSNAYLPNTIF